MSTRATPTAVIFDLDGTILDTEVLCYQVGEQVVAKYGKQLTKEVAQAGIGKRPMECWEVIANLLEINATPQELFDLTEPQLTARWPKVKALPGARRIIKHLHSSGVPLAIATSSSRASLELKLSEHVELRSMFTTILCGDEVVKGKPAPDIFLAAAKSLGVEPACCLVVEDAPSGIEAALAAGMQVAAIPSLVEKAAYRDYDCHLLASLLDFKPSSFGLPALEDFVCATVPVDDVWRIKGPVVKGFGRGSKELGIPTANLSTDTIGMSLADAVTGIYYGWASVGDDVTTYKMVMSIGYNPFYGNTTKTCEPWLLAEFEEDFYGHELRLVVCGYIRPEADFTTLEALIERIHEDANITRQALLHPSMACHSEDPHLRPNPKQE